LNKTSFAELLHICDKETLYEIISNWVYLHEYYHQQGSLPYDKNKKIKSLSLTAGVEELRVDLNVMIFALRNSEIGLNLELYQFVLSERLFAYIGQRSKNSYDSIASEILNHYVDLEASPNQMLKIFEKLLLSIDQIEEQFRLNKSNCKTSSGFKLEEKYYEIFSFLRSEV
jgi:RNAse (barnase) inhibitor barstar